MEENNNTLLNILGNEPGTKAKTLKHQPFFGPVWTFIEQHRDRSGTLYWTHYEDEKGDATKHDDWDFSVIEFYYDVNEPIWMKA